MQDILKQLWTNSTLVIVLAVLALVFFWYAAIIGRRNRVQEALGGIDAQLTQRHDLIPNLLEIARAFMVHEKSLLAEITSLRSQAQAGTGARKPEEVAAHLQAEAALSTRMGQFFALAENYPELKSEQPMLEAQRAYRNVEDNIAAARRFYNSSVTALNNSIQIPPGNLLARLAGVAAYPFYEAAAEHRQPVSAAAVFRQ